MAFRVSIAKKVIPAVMNPLKGQKKYGTPNIIPKKINKRQSTIPDIQKLLHVEHFKTLDHRLPI